MWPFNRKQKKGVFDLPRYKENPVYLFFEDFVLDAIGKLPEDRIEKIQAMNLQNVFNVEASDWREAVRKVLNLSDTIEIAALDLWIRNRENYYDNEEGHRAYAQDFTDKYIEGDSQVDVWPEGALDAAKSRIENFKNRI